MNLKKIIHIFLLITTVIAACCYLFMGQHGIHAEQTVIHTIREKHTLINQLRNEITTLEKELSLFKTSSFLKEKIAREELHMSCTNEWTYMIG